MEKNKSYVYLLPMLNKHLPIMKFFKNLKNTYIFPKNGKEQIIYLTYKYPKTNLERFLKYEDTLFNSEYFEEVIENEDYTTYVFKIPSEYSNDYNCFIEGKYSKINYKTQEEILEF